MAINLTQAELIEIKRILAKHLESANYRFFGSRTKGTAKKYSDLDIVLISEKPISLSILSKLEEEFAESDLSFKVDLVDWNRITPEFQEKIRAEMKEL